jgi:hypothetical protein
MKTKWEKEFDIQYEYIPSEHSEMRLQRAFEIIFEKIIKMDEYSQTKQKHLTMTDQ